MQTEFISSVSHELRTPLTAITGWGETLLADDSGDIGQLHRGVRIILRESRRLTNMVEELLEFSKIEDGRFTLRVEQMDLQAEVEDAIYTYRELFRQDGIDLEYSNAGEMFERPITGDPERLKQVLCNVLDNAAKHGGSGKRITVSMEQDGEWYVVQVRDYGPGIPEAELPYVKQKFYKGSSKARGSGIGLAVCDEIIRRHEGTFDIGNAPGGGCVVTIRLPISHERRIKIIEQMLHTPRGLCYPGGSREDYTMTHGKTRRIDNLPYLHRRPGAYRGHPHARAGKAGHRGAGSRRAW